MSDASRPSSGAGEVLRKNPREAWIRALARTAPYARGEGPTLPALVADMASGHAERPALIGQTTTLTYAGLLGRVRHYAHWAQAQNLAEGEVVALMLSNSPDYVALWLGISAMRGVAALVNPALTGAPLRHVLAAVDARHVIVDPSRIDALAAIVPDLPRPPTLWRAGLDLVPGEAAAMPDTAASRAARLSDLALHIYTSGTTGLPKAARVSHRRIAEWSGWFAGMIDTTPDDRMFNCLPMYHSVGGVVAIGAMLAGGGSVLVREKFSAGAFWDDVCDGGCTVFQYIGELCRYLVNTPPHPRERAHRLRLACGNGLRGDVWPAFQSRFAVPSILEFYAATEGNVSLYNVEGRPGAIGHVPGFLAHRFPIALVACDPETRVLRRGPDGLCVRCGVDEPGEALGRIAGPEAAGRPFEGYADDDASAAKIARDVLAPGDAWFRTGDLMRRDAGGFYYFVDRLGDTFRWKGENVATEEVATALRRCPGVVEAVVYGVAVPGTEGRAGMAALMVSETFDLVALREAVAARLPAYARPVFVRLCGSIAATGTFKPQTAQLARDGFDPAATADPLYVDDRAAGAYRPLDAALYAMITEGRMPL